MKAPPIVRIMETFDKGQAKIPAPTYHQIAKENELLKEALADAHLTIRRLRDLLNQSQNRNN